MRDMLRNRRPLWYANPIPDTETDLTDQYGNPTGETTTEYTEPKQLMLNVSASTGEAVADAFGAFTNYSRTIATADLSCPLIEGSRVWFGKTPKNLNDFNYIVVKEADSLNGLLYAIKEVV